MEKIHNPRVIFNQENNLDLAELVEEEATHIETPLDSDGM